MSTANALVNLVGLDYTGTYVRVFESGGGGCGGADRAARPEVLAALAGVDRSALSDAAMVDLLAAAERQNAWLAGWTMPIVAAVGTGRRLR